MGSREISSMKIPRAIASLIPATSSLYFKGGGTGKANTLQTGTGPYGSGTLRFSKFLDSRYI